MNWYIGQDIVAVKDHSQGRFKRGDEFKISGLRRTNCRCGYTLIDIGIKSNSNPHKNRCARCGNYEIEFNLSTWYSEVCFAPLDPIKEAISNLIEETLTVKQL